MAFSFQKVSIRGGHGGALMKGGQLLAQPKLTSSAKQISHFRKCVSLDVFSILGQQDGARTVFFFLVLVYPARSRPSLPAAAGLPFLWRASAVFALSTVSEHRLFLFIGRLFGTPSGT